MLNREQELNQLTAIELAQELSYKINNTTNPIYIESDSFENLIELDFISFVGKKD